MPAVTVDSKPNGLPMATATWPGRTFLELPSRAGGQPIAGLGPQHGDVGVGVAPEKARGNMAAVGQGQLDRGGAFDHVVVGEDQAVGRENGARARALGAWPWRVPRTRTCTTEGETASTTLTTACE